jgi:predicted dehydrogenase
MKRYKVGLIGCGRIGSLLESDPLRGKPCTHAGGFSAVASAKLVAGCDIDPERLKEFGRQWEVQNLYSNYLKMLKAEPLDIVCIATWTHLHQQMVLDSARLGIKGIFCEKPIANDLQGAKKMVRACEKKGISLIINHERRWDLRYKKALSLIKAGKIGEIRTIIGNALSWSPPKLPRKKFVGGGMFHDGTHLTDLLLYFGGPADWVSGHDIRPNGKHFIEESSCAMIRFKSGAMGFIEGGGSRKYFNFELDIQGDEGRLLIGNSGRRLFVTKKSKRFSHFQELEEIPFPEPKKFETPFAGGARDMVRCLKTGNESISSGRDGLQALQIILSIYESAEMNGKRLKIK